jgi:threonine dehydrogenase-like Zn-dependent dehydrogenase
VQAGERVLITGLGAIGLYAVQGAKARGGTVWASSSNPHRRKLATAMRADRVLDSSHGHDIARELKTRERNAGRGYGDCGVDVAIECSGKYHNLAHAVRATRQCGRVVCLGFYEGGAANINFGEEIFHNRLSILASLPAYRWRNPLRTDPPAYAPQLQEQVIAELRQGTLSTDGIMTYVPDAHAPAVIAQIMRDPGEIVKIVIEFTNS